MNAYRVYKVIRGTFVYRGGRLVAKGGPEDISPVSKRSDLPCPMIIADSMDYLQCQANGRWTDSKSEIRRWHREAGVMEVGNEMPSIETPSRPKVTKAEIGEALQKVREGYRPEPLADAPDIDASNDHVIGLDNG